MGLYDDRRMYRTKKWRSLRQDVFERDGRRCRECGKAGMLECDHRVPVSAGGDRWDIRNLQTLCRGCHMKKTYRENNGCEMPELSTRERHSLRQMAEGCYASL